MSFNRLVIAGLMVFLAMYGCSKKKSKETESIIDSIKTSSSSAGQKSDDIFNEFYDESGEKKKAKQTKSSDDFPSMPSDVQFSPNGRYVVQISCVLSKRLAQKVASKLSDKGYPAYIAEVENPTPELLGLYYRVRVGGFDGLSRAKSFADNNLTREGYYYWIDNRSNDNVGMGGRGLGESSGSNQNQYQSYQEPAAQTAPTPWKPAEPAPAAPQESNVTPPAATEPDEWGATQPEAPAVQEPVKPKTETPAKQQPANKSPFKDEWGADTTGW